MTLFKLSGQILVFDVESIGLYGEGFAVGSILIDKKGKIINENFYACNPDKALGSNKDREWVKGNVPTLEYNCESPADVRNRFWIDWINCRNQGGVLMAECTWPVKTSFLNACVEQNFNDRECKGPYPLYDLSSILMAKNIDPLKIFARLPKELPVHHPLMDARQTARILLENF